MTRLLLIALMLVIEIPAQSDATLPIYVRSKGAKFIADYTGGAQVTVREKSTGRLLAEGITKGGTGDTDKIMKANTWQTMTNAETAVYRANLPIDTPTEIEIIATGPLNYPDAITTASRTQWVFPDQGDQDNREVIIELAGLIVTPNLSVVGLGQLELRAQVRMLCGCPLRPGGTWDASNYRVWAEIYNKTARVATEDLSYTEDSWFGGVVSLKTLNTRDLSVRFFAASNDHQNTGMVVYNLNPEKD